MTPPFAFNFIHRGLSCHKWKKKFCHHKSLENFHIKSPPTIAMGGGAETMYNQITFIFSKEYYPCTWLSFVNEKNEKTKKLKFANENCIYWS